MIPVLQFDPASQSLWYDPYLINRSRGAPEIGRALELAIIGDDPSLKSHVNNINDTWIQTRAVNIASAIWHEKRHFVDFMLTNYGAFRMRQFFIIYANMLSVISEASKMDELLVPIQSYLNASICREMKVAPAPEPIKVFARDIKSRKNMLQDDRDPIQSRFGKIEIGGEALFEAVAHFVQTGKVHRTFGREYNARIQRDVPDASLNEDRYWWAVKLMAAAGLLDMSVSDELDESGFHNALVHDPPFLPMCYAALACRLWKQEQKYAEDASSYLPKYRFATLGIHLRNTASTFRSMSSVDCWDYMNDAAKTIFGKSIKEEIEDDYAKEEKFINTFRESNIYSTIIGAYEDYHELRGELIGILNTSPELIIDQATWSDQFVRRLQPFLIVAATAGEEGAPPDDYDRVLGYVDTNVRVDKVPEATWWWAASPKFWPNVESKEKIALKNREAWLSIAGEFAPTAKLLLDGRSARTMLGPELLRAEANIVSNYKVNVRVDPRFAYPVNAITLDYWKYLTGRDAYRCDLSYETVPAGEGCIVDPWALRLKTGLLDELLGDMKLNYQRYLAFWRDWSPWLLSEEFKEIIQSYEDNRGPLTSFWKADASS